MSKPSVHQALRWIAEQTDRMGALRNANTRDPGFREWRQNTVTVLQRIWPGQSDRAQRFRRVPFAPPSSRATDQEARECFERGFAEARKLLKMWETELRNLGTAGLASGSEGDTPEPAPLGNIESAPDVPTVSLSPRTRSSAGASKSGERQTNPSKSRHRPKQQLRDMLGLGHLDRAPEDEAPEPTPAATSPPKRSSTKNAARGSTSRRAPDAIGASPPDALGQSIADALEHARSDAGDSARSGAPNAPDDLRIRRDFEDPTAPAREAGDAGNVTSIGVRDSLPSREFLALISELDRLGIEGPEASSLGHALAELGAHLDQGSVPWDSFRDVMALVMTHPALARRAVPLLARYFDAAA